MRKKVRRSLALLMTLAVMMSMIGDRELFVSAENASAPEQATSAAVEEETPVVEPEQQSEVIPEESEEAESPTVQEAESVQKDPAAETAQNTEDTFQEAEANPVQTEELPNTFQEAEANPAQTEELPKTEEPSAAMDPAEGENAGDKLTGEGSEEDHSEILEYIPDTQPDGVTVKAYAKKGVLPDGAVVKATALSEENETAEQYNEAANALENSGVAYDDFMAFDISFQDAEGNQIEPEEGTVQVKFELDVNLLPENAAAETLEVQHLTETEEGIVVETVADTADATDGTVEVKTEDAVVAAEFQVESFSTFTITWSNRYNQRTKYFNLTVHYMEESAGGKELPAAASDVPLEANQEILLSDYAAKIAGYNYSKAVYGNAGHEITEIRAVETGSVGRKSRKIELYNGDNLVDTLEYSDRTIEADIYMLYEEATPLESFRGDDTSGIIDISVYDYNTGTVGVESFPFDGSDWTGKNSGPGGVRQGVVNSTLTNGYPVLKNGTSLDYLFNENTGSQGRVKTITDANYLLRRDGDGYYYYDSKENFAKVDNDGNFELYDVPRAVGDVPASIPLFLPFNTLTGTFSTITDNGKTYKMYDLGESDDANYSFGMEIGTTFIQPKGGKVNDKDMIFEFSGDDDVWVFIDDVLVLDLGGVHDNYSGSINFATGNVSVERVYQGSTASAQSTTIEEMFKKAGKTWDGSDYSSHTMKFFYLERGRGGSNCKIRFNLQTIPKGTINFQKELAYSNVADAADFEFEFKTFVSYDGTGAPYSLYTGSYKVYKANAPDTVIRTGTATEGIIKLKDGEFARLDSDEILATSKFYIQEIGATSDKYDVTIDKTKADIIYDDGDQRTETGVTSPVLEVAKNPYIVFKNSVSAENQFNLEVKKNMKNGQESEDTFHLKVLLGDTKIPYSGDYILHKADGTTTDAVATDGIISLKAGEYAEIKGLVGGNTIRVEEVNPGTGYESPKYIMTPSNLSQASIIEDWRSDSAGITGKIKEGKELGTNPAVTVQVTNSLKTGNLKISKRIEGIEGSELTKIPENSFTFTVKDEEGRDTGTVSLPVKNAETGDLVWETTLENLLPGSYTITESAKDTMSLNNGKYALTTVNGKSKTDSVYGVVDVPVAVDQVVTAQYINSYTRLCNLTISKTVTGNMGDKNKEFHFQIDIKDENGQDHTDLAVGTHGSGEDAITIDQDGSFVLKHGQSVTIPDIPDGYTYQVKEDEFNADGYQSSVNLNIGTNDPEPAENGVFYKLTDDTTVSFVNDKDVITPTGLHDNRTPFVIMLTAASGVALWFALMQISRVLLRRRRR